MLANYNFLQFDVVDSTQAEARRRIAELERGREFIITARRQDNGRGRYGRQWDSSFDGNLYLSIALKREIPPSIAPELSLVVALSLFNAIKPFAQEVNMQIKWPNDLLINEKKFAGILVELISDFRQNEIESIFIIGIGVNINDSPKDLGRSTTSLRENNILVEKEELIKGLIAEFDRNYHIWNSQGFDNIKSKIDQHLYGVNQLLTFDNNKEKITGKFLGISSKGAAIIEQDEQKERILFNF